MSYWRRLWRAIRGRPEPIGWVVDESGPLTRKQFDLLHRSDWDMGEHEGEVPPDVQALAKEVDREIMGHLPSSGSALVTFHPDAIQLVDRGSLPIVDDRPPRKHEPTEMERLGITRAAAREIWWHCLRCGDSGGLPVPDDCPVCGESTNPC